MTVAVTSNKVIFVGNGSTTVFAIPFEFTADSQITAYLRDNSVTPSTETLQVIVTNYTISGSNLTMVVAPASTEELLIRRDVVQSQATDYINTGSFPAETHETALDKLTFLTQQLEEITTRALVLPNSMPSTFSPDVPEPEASHLLKFNAGLTGFEQVTEAEIVENADIDHGNLNAASLLDDDHTQYALLLGRSGGQTIRGGISSGDDLQLLSTSDGTKGDILLGTNSTFSELNTRLGLGTTSPDSTIDAVGGSALLPAPASAPADGDYANSQYSVFLDESNDEFEFKGKKSDGTVITATVGTTSGSTRSGESALGSGVSQAVITFSTALASTNYSIAPSMTNLTDSDPLFFSFRVVAKSTTGFTVDFNDLTDSANYVFEYTATGFI